jgi:hypothetical protein
MRGIKPKKRDFSQHWGEKKTREKREGG